MESLLPILWWHWCVAGLVLLVLELLLPGVFLLWIGLGALVTSAISFLFGIESWEIQSVIFVPLCFAALLLGRKFIKRAAPVEETTLNRRLATYIGRTAEVTQAIVNGKGRISLGDSSWMVQGDDCPVGTRVEVTGVNGSELIVKQAGTPEQTSSGL